MSTDDSGIPHPEVPTPAVAVEDALKFDSTGTHESESSRHIDDEDTFWEVETGLIVLEAGGKFFCAQRSILRHQSRIFRDMLSIPQPPLAEVEQYDGKPLVRLSDRAKELQCFLKALHHYHDFYKNPISSSIPALAAILRLSTKYEVPHLQERTIRVLPSYLPISFPDFERIEIVEMSDEEIESMIAAVEEAGARKFLPLLKYIQCKRIPIFESYSGASGPSSVSSIIPTLILRQFEIRHLVLTTSCRARWANPPSCPGFMETSFRRLVDMDYLDPLCKVPVFEEPWAASAGATALCSECAATSLRNFAQKRRKLWKDLPGIFGLPSWEELLKE